MAEAALKQVPEQKRDVKLSPSGLHFGEHQRNVWVAVAERNTTKEDMLTPSYWSNVAAKLRPWDHIEVRAEDGTYYATYLVTSCDRTWAKVHNLSFHDLTGEGLTSDQAKEIEGSYDVKWRAAKKWSVIRKLDRTVLQEGMHTEKDAREWLGVYLRSQNIPTG